MHRRALRPRFEASRDVFRIEKPRGAGSNGRDERFRSPA